nr:hypothetical protein [Tanacetum cinerariifolium]
MFVIEQPLPVAPAADSAENVLEEWNTLYDAYNEKSNNKSLKAKGKSKANGKGKDKQGYIPKPKNPKPAMKEHPAKMTPATTTRRWVIGRGIVLSILLSC